MLYSGTSGGNTSNSINNGTLNYPCVLDLLSGNGITFKNYNFHRGAALRRAPAVEHPVFALPTLASINHMFDKSTPKVNNQANGAPFPPRDGNSAISNLTQCFTFG